MDPTVTYSGRCVEISSHTEWTLQEDDTIVIGEEIEDRWEPDDYDVDPCDGEDEP